MGSHRVAVVGGSTAYARASLTVVHHFLVLQTQRLLQLAIQIDLVECAAADQPKHNARDHTKSRQTERERERWREGE